ncbi:hypothetical protein MMC10_002791 [Thelotrema lepadinum]|nr:hypothetical protein [Thelotrema lepadinum]
MVSLEIVRASNAKLKDLGPGLVAVFVGGTSGIGESTLKAFAKNTVQPRIYIIGRNEAVANTIIASVSDLNASATVTFIRADISTLKAVDAACDQIKSKEKHINLLFLTCGVLSLEGRAETPEGIDKKLAINYYSRFRFVSSLLPLLKAASIHPGGLARVTSVLSAGFERAINESDLALSNPGSYSLSAAWAHACVMNSFATEFLAAENPEVGFVHMYPGFVKTGQFKGAQVGWVVRGLLRVVGFLASPLAVDLGEAGERGVFIGTGGEFGPKGNGTGTGKGKEEGEMAVGSDGVKGSGAYLLKWDGSVVGKQNVLKPMRERGLGEKVWKHTLEMFERVEGMEARE